MWVLNISKEYSRQAASQVKTPGDYLTRRHLTAKTGERYVIKSFLSENLGFLLGFLIFPIFFQFKPSEFPEN